MRGKTGKCTACPREFELDAEGQIPSHTKPITGICYGSNKAPFVQTVRSRGHGNGLPNHSEDFDVKVTSRGQPETGKRR